MNRRDKDAFIKQVKNFMCDSSMVSDETVKRVKNRLMSDGYTIPEQTTSDISHFIAINICDDSVFLNYVASMMLYEEAIRFKALVAKEKENQKQYSDIKSALEGMDFKISFSVDGDTETVSLSVHDLDEVLYVLSNGNSEQLKYDLINSVEPVIDFSTMLLTYLTDQASNLPGFYTNQVVHYDGHVSK